MTPIGMIGPGLMGSALAERLLGMLEAPRSRGVAISTTAPSSMSSSPLAATAVRHESHARHTTRIVFFFLTGKHGRHARGSAAATGAHCRPLRSVRRAVVRWLRAGLDAAGVAVGLQGSARRPIHTDARRRLVRAVYGGTDVWRSNRRDSARQSGDRIGRARAMGISILFYSVCAGLGAWVQTQEQMLVLRFMVGLGVGGVWPNAVALVAECWPDKARPAVAGVMGAAINAGILMLSQLAQLRSLTADSGGGCSRSPPCPGAGPPGVVLPARIAGLARHSRT